MFVQTASGSSQHERGFVPGYMELDSRSEAVYLGSKVQHAPPHLFLPVGPTTMYVVELWVTNRERLTLLTSLPIQTLL